jgi:hypothetical protein
MSEVGCGKGCKLFEIKRIRQTGFLQFSPQTCSGGQLKDALSMSRLIVRLFEEIAGIEQHLQPGRIDGVDDSHKPFGRSGKPPVVFQAEYYTALLGGLVYVVFDRQLKAISETPEGIR